MLIEPESKVSVPPTVVTRIRSRTPARETVPAKLDVCVPESETQPLATQMFPDMLFKTTTPLFNIAADANEATSKPAVVVVANTEVLFIVPLFEV